LAGQNHIKPRAIGTVQIQVLNALSQEVLSKTPSQQFEHPIKGRLSSRWGQALEEKNQSNQALANRRLKDGNIERSHWRSKKDSNSGCKKPKEISISCSFYVSH
jgi:hypothetical protein